MKKITGLIAASCISTMLFTTQAHSFDGFGSKLGDIFNRSATSISPVMDIQEDGTFQRVYFSKSVIKRSESEVCVKTKARDLDGSAYTGWWIIYNNPESCTDPISDIGASCGAADLTNSDAGVTGMWAVGSIAGETNRAYFDACISVGETTHAVMPFGDQQGLTDPYGAEIHFILRNHGSAEYENPELLGQQLNSYMGGCNVPDGDGDLFDCYEEKVVIHSP